MIYTNIEARCQKKGMSISALEKAAGLGNATIRGWREKDGSEKGSLPRIDTLQKVALALDCTVDELLKEE